MPRALEIPIEVTRVDRAADSIRSFSGGIRGVGAASETAAERASRSWERAMQRIQKGNERYLNVSGPASRLTRARAAQEAAVASGDEGRVFDANAAVARATVGMERARKQQARTGGGTALDRLIAVVNSTRFNAGPISPLIGRTAQLLGLPTTGAAGLGVAGAAAAAGAFAVAIHAAVQNLNQFGAALRLSGGTPLDVAGIGRYGFRGEEGAAAAGGFRQRIATDPMAAMFAARLGIRALPEPFGEVNNAQFLRRAAEGLRGITNVEERLRTARVLGIESALRYLDVSPRVARMLDAQATAEERIAASGGPQAANDLSVSMDLMKQSFDDLAAAALPGPIRAITAAVNTLTAAAQGNGEGMAQWFDQLQRMSDPFGTLGLPPEEEKAQDDHTAAVKANTEAHKDTQAALKAFLQPGTYGGGRNTAAALPTGWSGDYLARNMEAGALGRGVVPGS